MTQSTSSHSWDLAIRGFATILENGWAPELVARRAIRLLLRRRLHTLNRGTERERVERMRQFQFHAENSPVAIKVDAANQQHYEVPTRFFELVLGPRKKYSCCLFPEGDESLAVAEVAALQETVSHAGLGNGQTILELGCGWGSLTLWIAEHFPQSKIVAVSNSRTQREFILNAARLRGLHHNLEVLTCDINTLKLDRTFDRVLSVEMFEHVRNHRELLRRISGWIREEGRLFVHIFAHSRWAYPFESSGAANWMGRHFFSGGMMPDLNWFERFAQHMRIEQRWTWSGRHYARTAELWLANLVRNREEVIELFEKVYGRRNGNRWFHRWRLFFLACAELFGFDNGQEWLIGHYLFSKVGPRSLREDSPGVSQRLIKES